MERKKYLNLRDRKSYSLRKEPIVCLSPKLAKENHCLGFVEAPLEY